jgi:hypothetical protein
MDDAWRWLPKYAVRTSSGNSYTEWAKRHPNAVPSLRLAEFAIRDKSERLALWIERHKSYVRIAGGTSLASVIALLGMTICLFRRRTRHVFDWRHFLLTVIVLIVFSSVWNDQRKRVTKWVCEVYVGVIVNVPSEVNDACRKTGRNA